MKPFVKGDFDGFLGLGLDNVIQILIVISLCSGVLGFDHAMIYGTILPGIAVSFLVGNLLYARAALKLARETGRNDVTALPYGINTPIMIAYVFLVMKPAKDLAVSIGLENPDRVAWQAGLVACFACGVIELIAAFFSEHIRRITPRAAMLGTLGGIALALLSLSFLLESFSHPIVGLVTIGVMFVLYFGRVTFGRGLPGIALAVCIGTAISWIIGLAPVGEFPRSTFALSFPVPVIGDLLQGFSGRHFLASLSIILPTGLIGALSSLQIIESAEAGGDRYPARPAMVTNGVGTIAAACFGSPFPMSLYIGHLAWKSVGARAGYSTLNGLFVTLLCFTGTASLVAWFIPADAGIAIIIWIGIIISVQAFEVVPQRHIVAVVVAFLPAFGAWSAMVAKNALRSAGYGMPGGPEFSVALLEAFRRDRFWIEGAFALEQGFIFCSLVLSAVTVYIVDRKFALAARWCVFAAGMSMLGLMHSWTLTASDTIISMPLLDWLGKGGAWAGWQAQFPAWSYAVGYLLTAGFLLIAARWARPTDAAH